VLGKGGGREGGKSELSASTAILVFDRLLHLWGKKKGGGCKEQGSFISLRKSTTASLALRKRVRIGGPTFFLERRESCGEKRKGETCQSSLDKKKVAFRTNNTANQRSPRRKPPPTHKKGR